MQGTTRTSVVVGRLPDATHVLGFTSAIAIATLICALTSVTRTAPLHVITLFCSAPASLSTRTVSKLERELSQTTPAYRRIPRPSPSDHEKFKPPQKRAAVTKTVTGPTGRTFVKDRQPTPICSSKTERLSSALCTTPTTTHSEHHPYSRALCRIAVHIQGWTVPYFPDQAYPPRKKWFCACRFRFETFLIH